LVVAQAGLTERFAESGSRADGKSQTEIPVSGNPMKQVIAIVKPFLAEKVVQALADLPLEEMVIREVKGYGRQKSYLERYKDNEFSLVFVAKVEISLILADEHVEEAIKRINDSSRTGRMGDGKILVLPVLREIDVPGE
jgi:nitrogen regulatory protein PII